jgi:hypothetical protein
MLDSVNAARIINSASGESGFGRGRKKLEGTVEIAHGFSKQTTPLKVCARPGCDATVKKATAKYCSIRCCAIDPSRQERLRRQARRAPIVPLAHQLSIMFQVHSDIEASLDGRTFGREDIPAGLQRLRAG